MSRLSNAIQSAATENRMPRYEPASLSMSVSEEFSLSPAYWREYRIKAVFGAIAKINDAVDSGHVIAAAKRSILMEVFGEFLPEINKVRAALVDYDRDKALQALENLQNRMFEI